MGAPASMEPPVGYHSGCTGALTRHSEPSDGTLSGGQFDWGGRLLKGNGGAQRSPQHGWKSCGRSAKAVRWLDCEADKPSRDESRA